MCAPYYLTLDEAAMRYALSSPEVKTVIPGMSSPAEVDLNVVYSDGADFPAELMAQLGAHNWPRNFYRRATSGASKRPRGSAGRGQRAAAPYYGTGGGHTTATGGARPAADHRRRAGRRSRRVRGLRAPSRSRAPAVGVMGPDPRTDHPQSMKRARTPSWLNISRWWLPSTRIRHRPERPDSLFCKR